jgi:hypothetical protein
MAPPRLFFALLLLLSVLLLARSAPLAQETDIGTPSPATSIQPDEGSNGLEEVVESWVPEPKSRGTFGIIVTCVLTLFLCVCE